MQGMPGNYVSSGHELPSAILRYGYSGRSSTVKIGPKIVIGSLLGKRVVCVMCHGRTDVSTCDPGRVRRTSPRRFAKSPRLGFEDRRLFFSSGPKMEEARPSSIFESEDRRTRPHIRLPEPKNVENCHGPSCGREMGNRLREMA